MASNPNPGDAQHSSGPYSPWVERAKLEEALGKMEITDEEATPLVIDDIEDDKPAKWLLVGRILHRNLLHIQTISGALKPAWGNPRGPQFRSMGENTFVAEFETQRDRDRIWEGSPWHVSRNAVVLAEFDDYMWPDEVKFDRLSLWASVPNLLYNLRNDAWGKLIAQQIDKDATAFQFEHVGSFLRARVSIEVSKPLRRWILIDSAKRKKVDMYDIQYERVPTSASPMADSDIQNFTALIQAPEMLMAIYLFGLNSGLVMTGRRLRLVTVQTRSTTPEEAYRRVAEPKLLITDGSAAAAATAGDQGMKGDENEVSHNSEKEGERVPKKKKPTPVNSAEAAVQPYQSE
ncbi:hypothetical protein D1007_44650 [Hordeum vulgare]|nr:hypothetical protein D1007_44650 [Hordeum vulgare]